MALPKMPQCTQDYWPSQGQGTGSGIEAEGSPGEKVAAGPPPAVVNDEGDMNTAAQAANASWHGNPAVQATPSNATGSLDDHAGNPTKAEGSTATQ